MSASGRSLVTVFGSINADLIFGGENLPLPGQTILARDFRIEAGGKGANQAVAAARGGAMVAMVGAVGDDALAAPALAGLKESGADLSRVASVAEPTGCASIVTDVQGRNQIVVALGANSTLSSAALDDSLIARSGVILLQMESPIAAVAAVIGRARAAGVRSLLNLAPAVPIPLEALRACGMIVVNEDEAVALAGWIGCPPDAEGLHGALRVDVVRTLGSEGAEACAADTGAFRVPAWPIAAVDTTAAGDCFIGMLAAELVDGRPLQLAMEWACAAAALCCTRRGSQGSLPRRAEVEEALERWQRST